MQSNKNKSIWYKILGVCVLLIAFTIGPIVAYYELLLEKCIATKTIYHPHPASIPLEYLKTLDQLDPNLLKLGREEMANHKLIIVGISRDNARDLPIMIKHIESIGSFFKDYRVIIFENDSTDGTKLGLDNWQINNSKVKIISKTYNNQKRPGYKFLAEIRNLYLDALEAKQYKQFDLVMMLDMDMAYGIDIRGIEDSFSTFNPWDAVCSNGIYNQAGNMFDIYAFKNKEFTDRPSNNQFKYWFWTAYWGKKIYPIGTPLVPVDSCFGGLSFYKKEFIKACRYDSIDDDCEHLSFHQCLKDKHHGRMLMNPSQVIRYSHYN